MYTRNHLDTVRKKCKRKVLCEVLLGHLLLHYLTLVLTQTATSIPSDMWKKKSHLFFPLSLPCCSCFQSGLFFCSSPRWGEKYKSEKIQVKFWSGYKSCASWKNSFLPFAKWIGFGLWVPQSTFWVHLKFRLGIKQTISARPCSMIRKAAERDGDVIWSMPEINYKYKTKSER